VASCAADDFLQYHRSAWGWWIPPLLAILIQPVYLGGVAIGATATSFLFMLLLFAHEHHRADGAGLWRKDPLRLARALVQPLIWRWRGALIVYCGCR
jgi:hypothetical protein